MTVVRADPALPAESLSLAVEGMTCHGCVATLRRDLGALEGVDRVDVNLDARQVVLSGPAGELDVARARARIDELGYLVVEPAATGRRWGAWELALAILVAVLAGALAFQLGSGAYLQSLPELNELIAEISLVGIGLALVLGLVVGFGPPTYAIAPALMGYVSASGSTTTRRTATLAVAFVGGLVLVDLAIGAALGLAGTSVIAFLSSHLAWWYAIAAVLLLALALINLRVWRPRLRSTLPSDKTPRGPAGAFALGVPFGLMACPGCTPLLLPVALGAAASGNVLYGAGLMGAFALGRGLPVALLGISTGAFQRALGVRRLAPWIERITGLLLLAAATWFALQFLDAGGLGGL